MSEQVNLKWPPLDIPYTDEFGDIDPDVYQAAGALWPWAERFAVTTLGDAALGLHLLLKAAAAVTHAKIDREIGQLEPYLSKTYKRLILDQIRKENSRQRREAQFGSDLYQALDATSANLDRQLLVQEILENMDEQTRHVLHMLVTGYTFEEIARQIGCNPHTIRIRFRRQCRKVVGRLGEDLKIIN